MLLSGKSRASHVVLVGTMLVMPGLDKTWIFLQFYHSFAIINITYKTPKTCEGSLVVSDG